MLKFDEKKTEEKYGKIIGYVIAYLIFTTILFFILKVLNKMPESWNYFHIMAITLLIVFVGIFIKKLLK